MGGELINLRIGMLHIIVNSDWFVHFGKPYVAGFNWHLGFLQLGWNPYHRGLHEGVFAVYSFFRWKSR